jgi:hypothetical protein
MLNLLVRKETARLLKVKQEYETGGMILTREK